METLDGRSTATKHRRSGPPTRKHAGGSRRRSRPGHVSDQARMVVELDHLLDFLEQPPLSMSVETMEFLLAAAASLREDILTASGETVR
jgi:hypothetical protein